MRFSEITGERVLDVLADIIEPAANIMQDEKARAMFERRECPDGMEPRDFFVKRMADGLPALIRSHRSDIIAILAAVEGMTVKEYAESLTIPKLIADAMELLTDKDFSGFLA